MRSFDAGVLAGSGTNKEHCTCAAAMFRHFTHLFRPPKAPEWLSTPKRTEVILAKLAGATCFFWIFYKMRHEGLVYLVRMEHWRDLLSLVDRVVAGFPLGVLSFSAAIDTGR